MRRARPRRVVDVVLRSDSGVKPVTIATGVVMRRYERSDASRLLASIDANRDRLARWMPWVPFSTTVQDFEDFIEAADHRFREGTALHLGLFSPDAVVGGVGASIGSLNFDEADLGYWLGGSEEGTGLAAEAARALIEWLFAERDMHRVTIRAAVGNVRSRALAERLGFTYEGVLREALLLDGVHEDAALYSLLEQEWTGH